MTYIIRNQCGAFCAVCQSHLSLEEDDWDTCDTCGGEGFPGEEDDYDLITEDESWIEIERKKTP